MNGNGGVEPDDRAPEQAEPAAPGHGAGPVRGGSAAPRRRLGALLGGLTLAVAALLVGGTVFIVGPRAEPASSFVAVRPSPSPISTVPATLALSAPRPSPSPQAMPTPTPQEWAAAVLPPIEPVAELAATRTEPGGTSIRTAFALTSWSGIAAAELAKGIEVTPPVEMKVSADSTAGTALLEPKAPLATGTTYRATLRLPDGSLAGSWVFQTSTPPRIARTLPGNKTTHVPLDTGIEITFDQDGVGDIAPFLAISPNVAGRFERHDRTAVFVPDAPLKPLTVYTVTIRRGVPLDGSDLVLEEDEAIRFETAPEPGPTPTPEAYISAERDLVETGTAVAPVLELQAYWPGSYKSLSRVDVRVYRFPTVEDAIDGYLALEAAPSWTEQSDAGLVRTAGLAEVARFTVSLQGQGWIRFPDPLAPGWYLVDIPRRGRDAQVVLQVTDVATTTIVASGQTLVWAHDLATGGPLVGARVKTVDGRLVGRTDADGLMLARTLARLRAANLRADPRAGVLVVRAPDGEVDGASVPGRASFVPVDGWSVELPFEDAFWRILDTDRSLFRQDDTIQAWGLVLPRSGGAPPEAQLRLTAGYWYDDAGEPPEAIARAAVDPDPLTGVFAASVPLAGLPIGDYELGLWVGNHRIAATSIRVGVIRKPAYQLEVATDRRVAVDGDTLTATTTATFFDGTRAPGIDIDAQVGFGFGEDPFSSGKATTGPDGTAAIALPVRCPDACDQWAELSVTARPADPEEADISASTPVLVFASRVVLDAEATVAAKRLAIGGSLHAVDLERLEREQRQGYQGEMRPQGAADAGATVTATIVEEWEVRIRTGRVYDFIAKKSVDTYRYETRTKNLGVRRATTDARGAFLFDMPAPAAGHRYAITLTAADGDGRHTSLDLTAPEAQYEPPPSPGLPTLGLDTGGAPMTEAEYAVGDTVRATVRTAGGAALPTGGNNRYLFFTARPGWFDARVQGTPTFHGTFTEADVPSLAIGAAWFDGSMGGVTSVDWGCGSSLATVEARIDPASRAISVDLAADAARYRPGEKVTLRVRTSDAAGRPVPASVVLRAIDEKLYAIGGALEGDAASSLYWWMPGEDGIVATRASHPVPIYRQGGGSTCGPGAFYREDVSTRSDFRDTLLFRRVTTGADGRATVSFDLSDDLTSWRISATAISRSLDVGQASLLVAVGLPLFVEAPLAPDYLAGERPVLRVRAYGDALAAGDPVTFTVAAPSLGMAETRVVGAAFTAVEIPLPALTSGDHEVLVTASAGSGAAAAADRLVRTIHVIDTRFTQRRTAYADLADGLPLAGGTGFVTFVFADAGRARFIEPLESLAAGYGERVDQGLAAVVARDLLVTAFGADPARFTAPAFDPVRYQVKKTDWDEAVGIALLPYASADLALSARVALVASDRFDVDQLRGFFTSQRSTEDAGGNPRTVPRETLNIALAGLAGVGEPVLPEIRAALADSALTIRERLYLALGAASLGDYATALAVERDLLGRYGERLGPWLRLRVGSSLDDTIEATALMALIGATVGDPAAEWAEAYVEENRAVDDLFNLQQVGYIARVFERTPAGAARVTYSLGGVERTVDIAAGAAFSLTLTPAQAATFSARPAAGRVGTSVSWDAPVDPASLVQDPSLTLVRTVTPAGTLRSDQLVEVTLHATFGPQAVDGCYSVVDVLPSGLAPLGESGQRVAFCLGPWKDPSGISGQFEGIGTQIATQAADGAQGCPTLGPDCHLLIVGAMAGSPAERAGLKAGDLVLEADGVSLDGLTLDAARDRIRGPKGTVVTLTIRRGSADPFQLEITRDVVQQKEVDGKVLADSVTYRARVVTPGIYRWEPAILQLAGSSESLALTPTIQIEIR